MSTVRWHFFRVVVPQGYERVALIDFGGWTDDRARVVAEWDAAVALGLHPVIDHRVVLEERWQGAEAEAAVAEWRAQIAPPAAPAPHDSE